MNKGSDGILVTGATGQQGGATARELLAAGHKIYAMTRNPEGEAAQALAAAGATLVQADLGDEASLRGALEGMWGVFAVQNGWEVGIEGEEEQGKRIARLAKEAGVQHFVYASVGSADKDTGIPHFDTTYRVEQTVREQGFPSYVILRPVFFMDNLASPWYKPAIDDGAFGISMKADTKLQMIAVRDIGAYARVAFERHEELNGRAIDIAGDSLTPVEAAAVLSAATGREIAHYEVPIEQVREFSDDFALMLEWFDAVGYSVDIEGNAQEFDVPATKLAAWATTVDWS